MHSSPVHQKFSPGVMNFLPYLDCMNLRKVQSYCNMKLIVTLTNLDVVGRKKKSNKHTGETENRSDAKPVSDILHICTAQICFVILLNLNNI